MQFRFRAKFFPEDVSEELIQEVTQVRLSLLKRNFAAVIHMLNCSFSFAEPFIEISVIQLLKESLISISLFHYEFDY